MAVIFVIDVGNTNIVLGVYQQETLLHYWRLSTNRQATADEYGVMIHNLFALAGLSVKDIEGVIMSSVVPPIMHTLEQLCETYLYKTPIVVGPGVKTGLNIRYENPREVGADRIVNAVGAIEQYGGQDPLVVVDFGTATTFDVIDMKGNYLGGSIVPGIGISTEALYQHAAKLPRIELTKPKSVIGRNTVQSMQAGIIFGYAGQVDGIIDRIRAELGAHPKVIATGGLAELIASESRTIDTVNPLLTLEGLRLIYSRNKC
nr:type III pantothenate kinase [Paenibacillus apiarius]